ncbi:hypothetical protein OSTOST_06762 [Ostertagia ostertagi]
MRLLHRFERGSRCWMWIKPKLCELGSKWILQQFTLLARIQTAVLRTCLWTLLRVERNLSRIPFGFPSATLLPCYELRSDEKRIPSISFVFLNRTALGPWNMCL